MLEEMTWINSQTVCKILVKDLRKKKVCARFVPHLLTLDQKHQHAASSVEFLEMADDDTNVLKRTITGDESWCFMYDPESKRQSATQLRPKKPKAQKVAMRKSRVQTMLTAFS
jgi:histone-lysine N-methyltransferase SETMAR